VTFTCIFPRLSSFSPRKGYQVAGIISRLKKPALFIAGNHDTVGLPQLLAEIKRRRLLSILFGIGQERRARILKEKLAGVQFTGYSTHTYTVSGNTFDIITARPYSMGGPFLSFTPHLRRRYGIDSMASSADLLKKLIDVSPSDSLIFLAHNGPTGLGAERSDIWGCDFLDEEGDYGDNDLEHAVQYARTKGKAILAVVAGHMHHRLNGGGIRQWCVEQQGTLYVNAARVPRIFEHTGRPVRHHVRLSFDGTKVEAEQLLVS
jgi:uncharacterized protein (TIGR04168 family)